LVFVFRISQQLQGKLVGMIQFQNKSFQKKKRLTQYPDTTGRKNQKKSLFLPFEIHWYPLKNISLINLL